MTPLNIITEFLQSIPAKWRKRLNLIFALTVVVAVVIGPIWFAVDPRVERTLLIIGGYLGFQSAANVATAPRGELTEKPDDDVDTGLAADEADGWHPEA